MLLVAILGVALVDGTSTACKDSAACKQQEGEETSLRAIRMQAPRTQAPRPCSKIGTLILDGYYWPTQPGDANDVRTFCRVNPESVDDFNYSCELPLREHEYGTVLATVKNFTFHNSEMRYIGGLKVAFRNAVKYFLEDPEVCAIICNVGFCSFYQAMVEEGITELIAEDPTLERKPMLLGSPILGLEYAPLYIPSLKFPAVMELKKGEALIIITADYRSLSPDLIGIFEAATTGSIPPSLAQGSSTKPIMAHMDTHVRGMLERKLGISCGPGMATAASKLHMRMTGGLLAANMTSFGAYLKNLDAIDVKLRNKVYVIGWNEMPGYKPVDLGGAFHNALLTSQNYRTYKFGGLDRIMADITKGGEKVTGVVMESTEQAVNSNDIRIDFGLPVWDFSTMGICLGAAAKGDFNRSDPRIFNAVFNSHSFRDCLETRAKPEMLEPKFGKQSDGAFAFYENLSREEVLTLTCVGGRPVGKQKIGRLMNLFNTGVPDHTQVADSCMWTALCTCHHNVMELTAPCNKPCPGSGNCGGGSFPYPCGANGQLCPTLASVPASAGTCTDLGNASRFGKSSGPTSVDVRPSPEARTGLSRRGLQRLQRLQPLSGFQMATPHEQVGSSRDAIV